MILTPHHRHNMQRMEDTRNVRILEQSILRPEARVLSTEDSDKKNIKKHVWLQDSKHLNSKDVAKAYMIDCKYNWTIRDVSPTDGNNIVKEQIQHDMSQLFNNGVKHAHFSNLDLSPSV